MSELDLQTKIEGLKKAIAEHKDFAGNYENDLAKTEQQLKDYNKIALPPVVFDDIYEAVESGVESFDFSDTDNYNIEYGIEYDGRVHCESHELSDSSALVEGICNAVYKLFTEMECPEDELKRTEQELKDLGKIALPPIVFDDIYEAIEKGVNKFDWTDTDNFDKEFSIDYGNKVCLENFDLTNTTDLVEMIVKKVSRVFTEMDCPEELDTTEDDNHPVEKLQN